jgi:DNA-binding CsgD family transcriptional regulator
MSEETTAAPAPTRKPKRKHMPYKKANRRGKQSRASAAKSLKMELRREQIAKLRLRGRSVRDIGRELGISKSVVQEDLTAIFLRAHDAADDAIALERQLSLERLDLLLGGIIDRATSADLEAIDRVLKIDHRRAKLLGLDAPAKLEHAATAGVSEMLSKVAEAVARKRQRDGAA